MHDGQTLRPVAAAERIEAMDVIRGFALLGIFLMNIEAMAGPLNAALSGVDPALRGADRAVDALVYVLVQGKFYPLFSLLFGMGFAVMMARAESGGRPFASVYLRRTFALLAIGLAHMLLVWSGDVLTAYALLALPLLAIFRHVPVRQLPWWALGLYLAPLLFVLAMGALGSLIQLEPRAAAGFNQQLQQQARAWAEMTAAQAAAYGDGSWLDATAQRARDALQFLTYMVFSFGWQVLGLFVLGCWFLRSGAIARPAEHARLYARLRWIAWPLGLALVLAGFALMPTLDMARLDLIMGVATTLGGVGALLMALGYLAWIVRGLQAPRVARALGWLAPAGRMALTNYLLQSLVGTWVFYGYGLDFFQQLPRAWQPLFVLTVFVAQVAFSRWWLQRFRFGPMEWLWRGLTYGRLPPLRAMA
ncbi:MAG TPA: DUF418 domain-containing protein [Lysobacter sp.]|nr:DUF418 domain-containing protein [Lysobacter sp.]